MGCNTNATLPQPASLPRRRTIGRNRRENIPRGRQTVESTSTNPPRPPSLRTEINYAHSFLIGDCHGRDQSQPIRRPPPPGCGFGANWRNPISVAEPNQLELSAAVQFHSTLTRSQSHRQRDGRTGTGTPGRGLTAWLPLRSINLSLVFTRRKEVERTREPPPRRRRWSL